MRTLLLASLLLASLLLAGCEGGKSPRGARPPPVGDAKHGEKLIGEVGCGACHDIPGVKGARGVVGPPLHHFAKRTFIGGEVPNSPEQLVKWLMNPHAVEPGTAMPALGLREGEARDVAAYLYTLD